MTRFWCHFSKKCEVRLFYNHGEKRTTFALPGFPACFIPSSKEFPNWCNIEPTFATQIARVHDTNQCNRVKRNVCVIFEKPM